MALFLRPRMCAFLRAAASAPLQRATCPWKAVAAQPSTTSMAVAARGLAARGFHSTTLAASKRKKGNKKKGRPTRLIEQEIEGRVRKVEKPRPPTTNALAYVTSTRNNTFVLFSDAEHRVLCKNSAGSVGFKGAKRSSAIAAQTCAERTAARAIELGVERVWIKLRGFGQGRNAGLRAITNSGLEVAAIYEDTPIPHGGCRPKRRRRI